MSHLPRAASLATSLVVGMSLACRGTPVQDRPADQSIAHLVDSLRAPVERAAGLTFKAAPRSAMRSREQVRAYLIRKLKEELPPKKLAGVEQAYRLFGLLPDTLNLESLLLALYSEQVAGFYDPDSTMLFGVTGSDPLQLKLVLAHEMVHALQGQYLPLDSILHDVRSNDRTTAAEAVLEGQATLVSIRVLSPGIDAAAQPQFWEEYREQIARQQASMPIFAGAPLIVREMLVFPYLDGAEFMRWWETSRYKDSAPYGPRMPVSTEQILHPDRYLRGDRPVPLRFTSGPESSYQDVLGEAELRVLEGELRGQGESLTREIQLGWGGDLYRVYQTPAGPALVWYTVWDEPRYAASFEEDIRSRLSARQRVGYRAAVDRLTLDGHPAVRFVHAPIGWSAWGDLPKAEIERSK